MSVPTAGAAFWLIKSQDVPNAKISAKERKTETAVCVVAISSIYLFEIPQNTTCAACKLVFQTTEGSGTFLCMNFVL